MTLSKKDKETLIDKYNKQIQSGELIQLEINEKANFRKEWLQKQDNKCPILGKEISFEKSTIDHMHKLKSEGLGGDRRLGLIRGILYSQANAWEGKVTNSFHRLGLHKLIDLPTALRNLADYLENPPIPAKFIYPGEEPRVKKPALGKRAYNKVIKHYFDVYPRRRKLPEKAKYLTKEWKQYIKEVESFLEHKQKLKKRRRRKNK